MLYYSLLGLTAGEKWSTGGITTLIGLGMTFLMLALLIGAIFLLRFILKFLDKNLPMLKSNLSKVFSKKKKQTGEPATEEPAATPEQPVVDADTMSVIEQSVRQYVSSTATDGKPHTTIKILSVKEVSDD